MNGPCLCCGWLDMKQLIYGGMAGGGPQWDGCGIESGSAFPPLQKNHPFRQNGSFREREGEGDKNYFEDGDIMEDNSKGQFFYLISRFLTTSTILPLTQLSATSLSA